MGDQLQQGAQARRGGGAAHDALAGAPPQGLEHHLVVQGGEGGQLLGVGTHQRGRHQVAEAQRAEFLVPGQQGRRPVEHAHALVLGLLQQQGGVEEGFIDGGILAHPHHWEVAERQPERFPGAEPGSGHLPALALEVHGGKGDRAGAHQWSATGAGGGGPLTFHSQLGDGADPHLLAGPLGGLHQGDA